MKKYIFSLIAAVLVATALVADMNYISCFSDNEAIRVPIVMYHNISDTEPTRANAKYTVSDEQLEKDIKYLIDNGYQSITVNELIDFVEGKGAIPQKPVIITFDDGFESFYVYAFPLAEKYNIKMVASVVGVYTDYFSENNDHNLNYSHLTWEQISEMSDSGLIEFQNHSYNMHEITSKRKGSGRRKGDTPEIYRNELSEDALRLQQSLAQHTGKVATTYVYPYGNISKEAPEIIKQLGFKAALTCRERVNEFNLDEGSDWLYNLGRFNRHSGPDSEAFIGKWE